MVSGQIGEPFSCPIGVVAFVGGGSWKIEIDWYSCILFSQSLSFLGGSLRHCLIIINIFAFMSWMVVKACVAMAELLVDGCAGPRKN